MLFIALSGSPSAGKTTLASGLTSLLKEQGYVVTYITEYAREYIKKYGTEEMSMADQLLITQEQQRREDDSYLERVDVIITDSPSLLGAVYGEQFLTEDPKDMMYYMKILEMSVRNARSFRNNPHQILFHLRPRRFINDGIRSNQSGLSLKIDERIRSFNTLFGDFIEVAEITIEDRIRFITNHLSEHGLLTIKELTSEELDYHVQIGKYESVS